MSSVVQITRIHVPEDRKAQLRPRVVEALARSIQRRIDAGHSGLLNPIRVLQLKGGIRLIYGFHRLEAHRQLGLDRIEAVIVDGVCLPVDPIQVDLDAIEENLCRRDLTSLERSDLETRLEALYGKRG